MFYSLGGIFDSAIFIFYRNAEPVTLFAQFRGKRLSIGQYAKILELPYRNPEGRAVAEVLARVGARVAGEHRHPGIVERFTVLEGELTVKRADQTSILRQGESAIIEPGIWHDWWNASDRDARVRVEVAPGERFAHIIPTPGVCRIYCSSHYALAALHESSAT
jgi:quercetin dioxygenase-like cupin family protein